MKTSGTWLVAAIVILAAAVAGLTLVYHWNRTRAAIEYFGPADAELILGADQVFLIRHVDGQTERRDITHVADLDDLQKALVEDASYRIPGELTKAKPQWTITLEFHRGGQSCAVDVDPQMGVIQAGGKQEQLDADPIREGMQEFFAYAISRTAPIPPKSDSE